MNAEGGRHAAPNQLQLAKSNYAADIGLRSYGGVRAVRCEHCGHVSPSQLHLDRHIFRHCCGTLRRAA